MVIRRRWRWAAISSSSAITYLYQVAHQLFNVQPDQAYLIFKYAVVAQAPLAVIACWVLARDISGLALYSDDCGAVDCFLTRVRAVRRTGDD